VAHHKSAIKRIRTSREARTRNRQWRSRLRTKIKDVRGAETPEAARAALEAAIPVIDSTARKGIIHKNAAARQKSRLTQFVREMEAGEQSA